MNSGNGSGRRINVEDAKIKTANVEIKALTVSGKQVTLAVFRQLIEEPIIDEDTGLLRGVPWGTVNYHSGVDCDDFKAQVHLHVVWQQGNELRRSCVRPYGNFRLARITEMQSELNTAMQAWVERATVEDNWHPSKEVAVGYTVWVRHADTKWQGAVEVTHDLSRYWARERSLQQEREQDRSNRRYVARSVREWVEGCKGVVQIRTGEDAGTEPLWLNNQVNGVPNWREAVEALATVYEAGYALWFKKDDDDSMTFSGSHDWLDEHRSALEEAEGALRVLRLASYAESKWSGGHAYSIPHQFPWDGRASRTNEERYLATLDDVALRLQAGEEDQVTLSGQMDDLARQMQELKDAYCRAYDGLAALDQLFIAV